MNTILGYLYIIYSLGIIPFMLGAAFAGTFVWAVYKNSYHKIKINLVHILYVYIFGYAIYLLLFRLACLIWCNSGKAIFDIAQKWVLIQAVIIFVSTAVVCIYYFSNRSRLNFQLLKKEYLKGALVILVITFFSILFTLPSIYDAVPAEITMASNKHVLLSMTDIAELNIYTASKRDYMYILFTLMSETINKNGVQICLFFSPVFLYPVICGVYIWVANTLFHESANLRKYFYIVASCCYFVLLFSRPYVGLAAFQNIWNDTTLMTSCWSPFIFSLIVRVIQIARNIRK